MGRTRKSFSLWRGKTHSERDELLRALHTHAGLMISSAVRVAGNLQDAEDIAQDIAEKLLRSPPANIRNWPAYLRTLAVNGALDRLRKRRNTQGTDEIVDGTTPESDFESHERADALRNALTRLSDRDALLFSLYYLDDLSQADIARETAMSENAVAVALHRVRKRLCEDLQTRLNLNTKER